jgi:hypothetical protein
MLESCKKEIIKEFFGCNMQFTAAATAAVANAEMSAE